MDWISIKTEPDCVALEARDGWSSCVDAAVIITFAYYIGNCCCTHYIAECLTQLKPCRVFCLLFLHDIIDPNWAFLLQGFLLDFKNDL